MINIIGDFFYVVIEMSKVLNVCGRVLLAVNISVVFYVEMEDGQVVFGELIIFFYGQCIKWVFFMFEKIDLLLEMIEVICQVDLIIIGLGSLYISIFLNLFVLKIGEEVVKAVVKKVYICNVMIQFGEMF